MSTPGSMSRGAAQQHRNESRASTASTTTKMSAQTATSSRDFERRRHADVWSTTSSRGGGGSALPRQHGASTASFGGSGRVSASRQPRSYATFDGSMEMLCVQLLSPDSGAILFVNDNDVLIGSNLTTPDDAVESAIYSKQQQQQQRQSGAGKLSSSAPSTPISLDQTTAGSLYQATVAYLAHHEGEVDLAVGDIVTTVKDLGNGWTLGRKITTDCSGVGGRSASVGIFPSNCVRVIASSTSAIHPDDIDGGRQVSCPAERCPSCRGSTDGLMLRRLTAASMEDDGTTSVERHLTSRFRYGEGSDDEYEDEEMLARRELCSFPPPVSHGGSLPRHQTDRLQQQQRTSSMSAGGGATATTFFQRVPTDAVVIVDSGPEADVDGQPYGFASSSSPTAGCRRLLAPDVSKPRMIVKPSLDRAAPRRDGTGPCGCSPAEPSSSSGAAAVQQDFCYFNPDYRRVGVGGACSSGRPQPPSSLSRSVVPPGQLELFRRQSTDLASSSPGGTGLDDCEVDPMSTGTRSLAGYTTASTRRQQHRNSSDSRRPFSRSGSGSGTANNAASYYRDYRVVDVPLPAPTPLDRQALGGDDSLLRKDQLDRESTDPDLCLPSGGGSTSSRPASCGFDRGSGYYDRSLVDSRACRLAISLVVGQLTGASLFLWMYFHLGYGPTTSVVVAAVVAVVVSLLLTVSRVCRCTSALLLPSLSTSEGRVAFVLVASGFLLAGPVTNVYVNMEEISRAMGCSAEQAYNQTMFLLQPFDAMMVQLNWTIGGLQQAAHNISRGLKPLEDGLDMVEMDLYNGKLQLYGTRKTCRNLVDTAFNACATGIRKAQDQCMSVMGALGTVYHHARDVLDRINPDRWSPKQQLLHQQQQQQQQQHLQMKKRQVLLEDGSVMDTLDLSATDRDICEPLDTVSVCQSLNDSDSLCQPSRWAGEAIQDAINATQLAMSNLRAALQFYVSSEPYYNARVNASRLVFQIRRRVQDEFARRTAHFHAVVSALKRLVPVAVLLLVHAAHRHLRRYLSSDRYDNVYVGDRFRTIDDRRAAMVPGSAVLPLRRYERVYLVDTTTRQLGPTERRAHRSGLAVAALHALLAVICCAFDYVLYWLLALVERHGRPGFDATGSDSLELVVAGDGIIVELLDVFLKGFHPGRWFSFSGDTHACLPVPRAPSAANFVALTTLQIVLFSTVVFRARLLRLRSAISGYFYRDREKARLAHLYAVIVARRCRLPRLLYPLVRARYRETQLCLQASLLHRAVAWFASTACAARCCRCRCRRTAECLVCGLRGDRSRLFQTCSGEACRAAYCRQCFNDLDRVCPLCQQSVTAAAGGSLAGFCDAIIDDEDCCNALDEELRSYCRPGGKIGV